MCRAELLELAPRLDQLGGHVQLGGGVVQQVGVLARLVELRNLARLAELRDGEVVGRLAVGRLVARDAALGGLAQRRRRRRRGRRRRGRRRRGRLGRAPVKPPDDEVHHVVRLDNHDRIARPLDRARGGAGLLVRDRRDDLLGQRFEHDVYLTNNSTRTTARSDKVTKKPSIWRGKK